MKKITSLVFVMILVTMTAVGCGSLASPEPASDPAGAVLYGDAEEPTEADSDGMQDEDPAELHYPEVKGLLEKGANIKNLSYTARFQNEDHESVYEYYKRDNLTKTVTYDGDSQFISVSDGNTTIYYSLPEKIGVTMIGSGEDMEFVPSAEALLNEDTYTFLSMGEETVSGYLCLVVETRDESGPLKIWISKTLGLPIRYIGADDNGWYRLELMDIQLGEPQQSIFVIPSDISIVY